MNLKNIIQLHSIIFFYIYRATQDKLGIRAVRASKVVMVHVENKVNMDILGHLASKVGKEHRDLLPEMVLMVSRYDTDD